jgi:opacity protein-like surface antigen
MRKTHVRFQILLICFLFLTSTLPLYSQVADNGLWTSVEIKKKLNYGLSLSLSEEYKMRDNFSNTDKFETTIDLSWKALSFLKGGIAYCRIDYNHPPNSNPTEYWELRHRYIAYVVGSYDIGRFSLSLREKFQQTNRVGVVANVNRSNPTNVLRSKFEVDYNIRKSPFTPYASVEVYYALNEPDGVQDPAATKMVSEIRNAIGVEYSIKKNLAIDAGYLYCIEKGWDKDALGNNMGGYLNGYTNVLTLGLSYSF